MRTKRNLFTFALGGVAGYVLGRYPGATYERLRDGAGLTLGMARDRFASMTGSSPLSRSGDHRAPSPQPPRTGDDVVGRTSPGYVARAHP